MNLPKQTKEVLEKARKAYGDTAQILVAIEELNELACVCAKYPRYKDKHRAVEELHDKAVDELADVYIVLDHIQTIFGISSDQIWNRVLKKGDRVRRWLQNSNDMDLTTVDRKV